VLHDLEQLDGEAPAGREGLPEARYDCLAAGELRPDGVDRGSRILRPVVAEQDGAARLAHLLVMA
jgi:hypothetical protein